MDLYARFWKNYLNFEGTASRKEFWIPFVINTLIITVLRFLATNLTYREPVLIVQILIGLLFIIPSTTLAVRRLRDVEGPLLIGGVYGLAILVGTISSVINGKDLRIITFLIYLLILVMLAYCFRTTKE